MYVLDSTRQQFGIGEAERNEATDKKLNPRGLHTFLRGHREPLPSHTGSS